MRSVLPLLDVVIGTEDEIKASKEAGAPGCPPQEIGNIVDYIKVLAGFMMDQANKAHLHQNDWHRTIFIDACGVKTTQFDLPDAKADELIESGRTHAKEYFAWFDDPAASPPPLNRT